MRQWRRRSRIDQQFEDGSKLPHRISGVGYLPYLDTSSGSGQRYVKLSKTDNPPCSSHIQRAIDVTAEEAEFASTGKTPHFVISPITSSGV
jgi:hypothetical protein